MAEMMSEIGFLEKNEERVFGSGARGRW